MAGVNIDILGISELKGTGRGEFNSDDRYIYYCVKNPLEEMQWLSYSTKWQNDLGLFPRQTLQHHSNPSLCPTTDAEEAEVEKFYEDLEHILELIPKKVSFSS